MDVEIVSHLDFRQFSADCELVVVLAERARDIIDMVERRILLAEHGDVVIGPVHGRAHQIHGAGINPDILFVDVLLVNCLRDKCAVGCQHKAPHLRIDCDIAEPRGRQNFLVDLPHLAADSENVVCLLLRAIGHADTAREVDERNLRAGLFF